MFQHYESTPTPESTTQTNRVIDYPHLVTAVQVSIARLLDVDGALRAHDFEEVLEGKTSEERQRIVCEVGARFDDELVQLVTVSLINARHGRTIILAEAHEGVDGVLPWQPKLERHLQALRDNGTLRDTQVQVERYTANDIELPTQPDEARTVQQIPIFNKA